jgi:ABC-2 type transport system permease protein
MVNAFRYGFLGVSDVDLSVALGVILVFITVLFTLALTLIKKGVGLRH